MRRIWQLLLCAVGISLGGAAGGCSVKPAADGLPEDGKPRVLASFAPLYCFARNVAGEHAHVHCLLTSAGPHSHGESIREAELQVARKSDLFLINGLGLDEHIAKKIRSAAGGKKLTLVEVGEALDPKLLLEGECHHDHGNAEPHSHGTDPHLWLCPRRARAVVGVIAAELAKADPAHAADYAARAEAYQRQLDQLLADGRELLKGKAERKILAFHDSLQYFAESFGLQIADVIEVDPGIEPGEKKLNAIIAKCLKEKVRVIAVEPQFPSRNGAQAILQSLQSKGADAQFVEIDTLETIDPAELGGEFYLARMRKNLEALARVLR